MPCAAIRNFAPDGTSEMTVMTHHAFVFAGLLAGFSVAVPLGPMGLLCIQRTLESGMRAGIATGLGAATVNVLYGGLVILGLDSAVALVAGGSRVLGFAGGVLLLYSAARTLLCRRSSGDQQQPRVLSPLMAYGSAVGFNATNPLSPLLLTAVLSPIVGQSAPSPGGAASLLCGMFMAATIWWICLSGCVALLRSHVGHGILKLVNRAAGAALTVYGVAALARSAGM